MRGERYFKWPQDLSMNSSGVDLSSSGGVRLFHLRMALIFVGRAKEMQGN